MPWVLLCILFQAPFRVSYEPLLYTIMIAHHVDRLVAAAATFICRFLRLRCGHEATRFPWSFLAFLLLCRQKPPPLVHQARNPSRINVPKTDKALTHHPKGQWYLPLAIRALREADAAAAAASRQCRNTCGCRCHRLCSSQLFPFWKQLATCPHKHATGSFVCGYDPKLSFGSFSLLRKRK